jgi:hypothetical protein
LFPKRKEKKREGKKKDDYENISKIFLHPKESKIFLHPKEKDIENKQQNIFSAI